MKEPHGSLIHKEKCIEDRNPFIYFLKMNIYIANSNNALVLIMLRPGRNKACCYCIYHVIL